MNIFEYAMQMEKDGENYYRQLIYLTSNKGIKAILTMLADDEVKHYNTIRDIQNQRVDMADTKILIESKNVFEQMKENHEQIDVNIEQIQLYSKAQEIEEKSRQFYLEKADQVEHEYQKELFLRLAEEEKKHYYLLDNVIEFVNRPETWLENAEFYHIEQY